MIHTVQTVQAVQTSLLHTLPVCCRPSDTCSILLICPYIHGPYLRACRKPPARMCPEGVGGRHHGAGCTRSS
jgi:hypothetical protein